MPPKKATPRRPEEKKRFFDLLMSTPVEAWPKEIIVAFFSARDALVVRAERGDKAAKQMLDQMIRLYVGARSPWFSYMAAQATRRRGPRTKISDEELGNAWGRLRRDKPKATASDLMKMLAFEGLGSFSADYLRRRLNRLP